MISHPLSDHELKKRGYRVKPHLGGKRKDGSSNVRFFLSLKRAVKELSIQDGVMFHGWVDDVASWLEEMDVFISNSYWEG